MKKLLMVVSLIASVTDVSAQESQPCRAIGSRSAGAFCGCSGLKSVAIPSSVTSICRSAFTGCSGLESVTIPSGVTNIGNFAFLNCSGLTNITILGSVTNINSRTFMGCTNLMTVGVMKNGKVEQISFDDFCKEWKLMKRPPLGSSLRARRLRRK